MRATAPGQTEAVTALIEAGADVNATNQIGGTARWMAEVNHHDETAAALQ